MKIIMKNQIVAYLKVRKVVPFIYERVQVCWSENVFLLNKLHIF